jgi:hypothetical protein
LKTIKTKKQKKKGKERQPEQVRVDECTNGEESERESCWAVIAILCTLKNNKSKK